MNSEDEMFESQSPFCFIVSSQQDLMPCKSAFIGFFLDSIHLMMIILIFFSTMADKILHKVNCYLKIMAAESDKDTTSRDPIYIILSLIVMKKNFLVNRPEF